MQKQFLLFFFAAFERRGQPVSPANPLCSMAMAEFAERIENSPPNSPGWLLLYHLGPDAYAETFLRPSPSPSPSPIHGLELIRDAPPVLY